MQILDSSLLFNYPPSIYKAVLPSIFLRLQQHLKFKDLFKNLVWI